MRAALIGLLAALEVGIAGRATADIRLSIHDGRVDLAATNASIPQILDAWARVGGTRVVNGNRLSASRVTLQLNGVPESEALQVILQSAAGFIAVPRQRPGGASRFERILILATSTPPATPPPTQAPAPFALPPAVNAQPSGARPVIGPDGRPMEDDQGRAPAGARPPDAPRARTPMPPGYPPAPPPPSSPPPAAAPAPTPGAGAVQGSTVPGAIVQQKPPRGPGRR